VDEEAVAPGGTEWTLVELNRARGELHERLRTLRSTTRSPASPARPGATSSWGTFALSEDELRFGRACDEPHGCAEDVMERETRFLAALERVTSYEN
jgi:hypothetical protein